MRLAQSFLSQIEMQMQLISSDEKRLPLRIRHDLINGQTSFSVQGDLSFGLSSEQAASFLQAWCGESDVNLRFLQWSEKNFLVQCQFFGQTGKSLTLLGLERFQDLMSLEGFELALVLNEKGEVLLAKDNRLLGQSVQSHLGKETVRRLSENRHLASSFQGFSAQGRPVYLSVAQSPSSKLAVLIVQDEELAHRALLIFLLRSLVFFGVLVGVAIFLGVYFSGQLTQGLHRLIHFAGRVSEGHFSERAETRGQDEVAHLALAMNRMTEKIESLLEEQKTAAALESEVLLAAELQKNFFPESQYQSPQVEVSGFYQASGLSGGDWWFYQSGEKAGLFLIGDATGHGVRASLITCAVRAGLGDVNLETLDLQQMMKNLNQSVYVVGRGQMQMTLCCLYLDFQKRSFTYLNASHEPVLFYDPMTKQNIFLDETHGPRLGETQRASYRVSVEHSLQGGERFLLYSDGVFELKDAQSKSWSDRKLLKWWTQACSSGWGIKATSERLRQDLLSFQGKTPLKDDLSFLLVEVRRT